MFVLYILGVYMQTTLNLDLGSTQGESLEYGGKRRPTLAISTFFVMPTQNQLRKHLIKSQ